MKTGVYFLITKNTVVYVGKTTKWPFRLKQHMANGMIWETEKFIEYPEDQLDKFEKAYIKKYYPPFNLNKGKHPRKHKSETKNPRTFRFKQMKLRKLTEKSIVGFGRHLYTAVHAVGDFELCQMYFNLSHINFFDDVLDRIGIPIENRIQKPGKLTKEEWFAWAEKNKPEDVKALIRKSSNIHRKNSINRLKFIEKALSSKTRNQSRNQGH